MNILAGALGGLGQGLVSVGQQMREDAREKRKRAQQLEDRRSGYAEYDRRTADQRSYAESQRQSTIDRGAAALAGGKDIERASYVKSRFVDMGYPEHVAAGLVGNLMQESGPGINTAAVGDGGNAYGMAQWNGPRRKAYLAYAESKGADPADLDLQIEYLDHEFKTTESAAYEAIMKTTNAEEAALVASKKFWRPGVPHNERRMAYARQLAEVVSDPEMPAQVRNEAASRLDSLQGRSKPVKLTGEEWVERNGEEVLMGRNETGKMIPYTDTDNKPITRKIRTTKSAKPRELSGPQATKIEEWGEAEGVSDEAVTKFKLKTEAYLQDGMTYTEAWAATLATANKTADKTEVKDGWFKDTETVTPGTYDGTFKDAPKTEGLGPAPSRAAPQATPKPPADPKPAAGQSASKLEILEQARDAIAQGADKTQVMNRLRENGIDPEML